MEDWSDFKLAKHCVQNVGTKESDAAFQVLSKRFSHLIKKGAKSIVTKTPRSVFTCIDFDTAHADALYAFYKSIYNKFKPHKVKDIARYSPVPQFENVVKDIIRNYWNEFRSQKRGGIGHSATDDDVVAYTDKSKIKLAHSYYDEQKRDFSKHFEYASFIGDFISILTEQERAMLDGIFDIADSDFTNLFLVKGRENGIKKSMRSKYQRLHREYWGA
jgi:hypothetical protein